MGRENMCSLGNLGIEKLKKRQCFNETGQQVHCREENNKRGGASQERENESHQRWLERRAGRS